MGAGGSRGQRWSDRSAAALVAALEEQSVACLFGIPGVHTLLPYDVLHDHPTICAIVTRHEGGAGFAADGYARATRPPGVCLVVPGPGATNLATALLVAHSDRVPLVAITATVPAALQGRAAIHELDLDAFCAPVVKGRVGVETAAAIAGAVAMAFELALAEPRGPVQLAVPYHLFAQQVSSLPITAKEQRGAEAERTCPGSHAGGGARGRAQRGPGPAIARPRGA